MGTTMMIMSRLIVYSSRHIYIYCCVCMSSVQNPSWVMISSGIYQPKFWGISHSIAVKGTTGGFEHYPYEMVINMPIILPKLQPCNHIIWM